MTLLDRLLPAPRLLELDHVDLAAPPSLVWERVRHGDLFVSPLVRALFALRTLPERLAHGAAPPVAMHLDDLTSAPARPGFQVLAEEAPLEVAVGAIGRVWNADIPFVHVPDADAYLAFDEPGYAKVAWSIRVLPRGERDARVEVEVRVDVTDEASWAHFERYFRIVGPGSHLIRRSVLSALGREFGDPDAHDDRLALAGDELLPDASEQITRGVTVAATPDAIWPWLAQMGGGRAGFYSVDALDNGNARSAREVHPEWQRLAVGDVIPATPDGPDGFEVLRVDAPRALVLGGLYDVAGGRRLPFAAARPSRRWQVTWSFALEALDATSTRLRVRARAAFSPDERLHAAWIGPVHHLMQDAQLRHLAARAEGRLARDDWRDALEGAGGAAIMALGWATPFLRDRRSHWGLDAATAAEARPGDELVPRPRWAWTHGVEIDAPAEAVWPWIAQMGADRAGFYSYQSLENLAGCKLRNAEALHPEWAHREGDAFSLHPKQAPMRVVSLEPGRHLLAYAGPDEAARAAGKPWAAVSWLFAVEALSPTRCRFVSRYRCDYSDDLAMRLAMGPALIEPVGFAMDRRMLLAVKARAERAG
jgi:hypothetical protein